MSTYSEVFETMKMMDGNTMGDVITVSATATSTSCIVSVPAELNREMKEANAAGSSVLRTSVGVLSLPIYLPAVFVPSYIQRRRKTKS